MPEIAVPGEKLGVEEEIVGDAHTFSENGEVFVAVGGPKKIEGMEAKIHPPKTARLVKTGDEVYGLVQDLYDSMALIVVSPLAAKERTAIGDTHMFLRISEVLRGNFIKSFREYIKIGDVVKAKIIEIKPLGTYVTISDEGLGVVKAHCSTCRTQMHLEGTLMNCPNCGNKEVRKLTSQAGSPEPAPSPERRGLGRGREGGRGGYGDRRSGGFGGRGGFRERRESYGGRNEHRNSGRPMGDSRRGPPRRYGPPR